MSLSSLLKLPNDREKVVAWIEFGLSHCFICQASLESEISRCGGVLNGFVSSTEEIISRFITQYFPTQIIKSVSNSEQPFLACEI